MKEIRQPLDRAGLLKLASEVGEADVELMLVEFVCPPYPKWTVDHLRQVLAPRPPNPIVVIDFQPECTAYDNLLSASETEVAHVG